MAALFTCHRGQAENFPVLHATAVPFDLAGGITEPEEGLDAVKSVFIDVILAVPVP
jgi:hypothetical protein